MSIKLIYFDAGGRAETLRLALFYGGVQFEDVRLTGAEFAQKKAEGYFKFGQVPVIEVDGKQFAESLPLLTWAGKQSGLYPQDAIQALKVDEAIALLVDAQKKLFESFAEQDPAKVQELRKTYVEKEIPTWFGYAEKLLQEEGTGYFAGDSPSIAGLLWYVYLKIHVSGIVDGVPTNIVDSYPRLKNLYELLSQNPKVVEYYKTHKN